MIHRLCVAVLLLLPSTALAQGNPGPFGGLFGREPERTGRERTIFEIRTSGAAQSDDRVLDSDVPVELRDRSGQIYGVRAGAMYAHNSDRLQASARTLGTYNEFASQHVGFTSVDSVGTLSARVATRLGIDATLMHSYAPYFNFLSYPVYGPEVNGIIPVTAQPYATLLESNSLEGTAGFTSYYSKHSTIGMRFSRRDTRFSDSPDNNFEMHGFNGFWTRQLNKSMGVRLEYGRDTAQLNQFTDPIVRETINLALDGALPLGRRTQLTLDMRNLLLKDRNSHRQYQLNGGVTLTKGFVRTWAFSAHAHRVTDFQPGFVAPLSSYVAGLRLSGMFSTRVELSTYADAGKGQVGLEPGSPMFTTARAAEQISVAISRRFAIFASHSFEYYEAPPQVSVIAPILHYARNSFTAGITTWIPVYTRERNPSDPR